jgi:hypothetical protein
MFWEKNMRLISRVVIPFLVLVEWFLVGLLPWVAYRFREKTFARNVQVLLLNCGIAAVFILQVHLIDQFLPPEESHGTYFHCFVIIEAGGALVLGFYRLFRERARSRRSIMSKL